MAKIYRPTLHPRLPVCGLCPRLVCGRRPRGVLVSESGEARLGDSVDRNGAFYVLLFPQKNA